MEEQGGDTPANGHNSINTYEAATRDERVHSLDHVTRSTIFQVLSVLEAAIAKVGSTLFDDFIQELSSIVLDTGNSSSQSPSVKKKTTFVPVPPVPVVSTLEVNQFYENAVNACEFTETLERRIVQALNRQKPSRPLDVEKVHDTCWKYYQLEKKSAITFPKFLSDTCTKRLFLVFNQLVDKTKLSTVISEAKLNFLLKRIADSGGFLGMVITEVIKNDRPYGVTFPEFLEKITNCFEYLKMQTCLTCELILDLLDELVNGVLKKGYLTKQGHIRHNWKRRYFILKENEMHYYVSRETMKHKGGMVLNRNSHVDDVPDEKGKPMYRFVINCGKSGKVFLISASDQRSKSEWMCAIMEAIAIAKLKEGQSEDLTGSPDNDIAPSRDGDDTSSAAAQYLMKYNLDHLETSMHRVSKIFNQDAQPWQRAYVPPSPSRENVDTSDDEDDDDSDYQGYMVMKPHVDGEQRDDIPAEQVYDNDDPMADSKKLNTSSLATTSNSMVVSSGNNCVDDDVYDEKYIDMPGQDELDQCCDYVLNDENQNSASDDDDAYESYYHYVTPSSANIIPKATSFSDATIPDDLTPSDMPLSNTYVSLLPSAGSRGNMHHTLSSSNT